MWGAAIMNGVIEEKSNRVVEVIVSSIPTSYLFAGKLLGVGAAGLTQVLVWVLTMAGFGAYGAAVAGGMPMPEVSPLLLALVRRLLPARLLPLRRAVRRRSDRR